jgi:hypothetical protein
VRLTLAQVLVATRRDDEAARLLARQWPGTITCGNPIDDVLWTMERARLHDRVGNASLAREGYRLVIAVWRGADAELQPMVREARAALARLGDVRSRAASPSLPSGAAVAGPSRRRATSP